MGAGLSLTLLENLLLILCCLPQTYYKERCLVLLLDLLFFIDTHGKPALPEQKQRKSRWGVKVR